MRSLRLEHQLFYHIYYMNFNKAIRRKRVIRHVVLNDLRNGRWTALIACANFSITTLSGGFLVTNWVAQCA